MHLRAIKEQLQSYAIAVLGVTVTASVRFALDPILHDQEPLLLFPFAVVIASVQGGFRPGLAATVLSVFAADYLFVRPRYTFFLWDPAAALVMMVVFTALGVAVSLIMERLKRAKARLQESASALQKSEFQLRALAATVPEILFTARLDGATDYVNPRFTDYSGRTPAGLLGAGWLQTVHPDDREQTIASWSRSVRSGDEFEITYRLRRADGVYRWFQVHAVRVRDSQNQNGHWFGVSTDIHEHKELEESLAARTKELLLSNEDLQSFAHLAGHDLQEPLRTIGIFTQMLVQRNRDKLNEEAEEFARHILEGVARMKKLIQDLLDYAVASRAEDEPPGRTDLNNVVSSAIAQLRLTISEAGATIACDRLPSVSANENGILRVFQNLIGNAIKYRSSEEPHIHISARSEEDQWILSVRDNGIGFDMAYADRIFESFQRLHSRADVPGSGIGLAIVKRIIERNGGRVWAESEPGEGSTFFFTLPTNTVKKVPQPPSKSMTAERTAAQTRCAKTP
jgi:PAS domain S-box-containing protein